MGFFKNNNTYIKLVKMCTNAKYQVPCGLYIIIITILFYINQ